ncbi:hypothetical protein PVK06_025064 [Gossypium arboreum]|uniref:RNase H type-1 domain-containing protein n=1 Tax=Gossypium arboreum TaxID=29729 RepID=A0ABR0PFK1_GOSAR|nr:hypothetical protein PVK06_025064 [Gossypium arboreum]
MVNDKIPLLEEKMIQFSMKSSVVSPLEKPTLVAGQNLFLICFEAEEDLEMILEAELNFVGKVALSLSLARKKRMEQCSYLEEESRVSTIDDGKPIIPKSATEEGISGGKCNGRKEMFELEKDVLLEDVDFKIRIRVKRLDKGLPWLVCGDFNEMLYVHEKRGRLPRDEQRMQQFRSALEDYELFDLGYSSRWYTWERRNSVEKNIRERLDRGVANVKWMECFPIVSVWHLTYSHSDHIPLLIYSTIQLVQRRRINGIKALEDESLVPNHAQMAQVASRYFDDLFISLCGLKDMPHILLGADRCITDEVNLDLNESFTEKEVFEALKGMGPKKALSRDGFSPIFFQKCWHIWGRSEGLSFLMMFAKRDGLSRGARASRNGPCITHFLFANDCILFGEATFRGVKGGNEVFIKAVLQAIPTYIMACFSFLNLFVMRWRVLWLGFNGKRLTVKEEFIGVNGGNSRKHLASDVMCPRCGAGPETLEHLFCQCLVSVDVLGSGSGVVIRSSIGQVLASTMVLHTNVIFAFAVEALACSDVVRVFKGLGLRKVIVEWDSLTVIKKCTSVLNDRSIISPFIKDVKMLVSKFSKI